MRIGVPREIYEGERRVATTPDVAAQLIKLGFDVAVEAGAGEYSSFSDDAYRDAFPVATCARTALRVPFGEQYDEADK